MESLKNLRKARGLYQKDIAKMLNVTISTVSAWENDIYEIDFKHLIQLADFFDVTVDELIGRVQPSLFDDARIEQQRVLQMYSQLTPHQQELVLERMQGFIDGNAERRQLEDDQRANRAAVQYFISKNKREEE